VARHLPAGPTGRTARLLTAVIDGVQGLPVLVEADLATALPMFQIVGMGDTAVREARERVRSAVRNAGFTLPPRRMTVNLAPADRRKEGAGLDLPIALALLCAAELLPKDRLPGTAVLGELSLDGDVRPTPGVLPRLVAARAAGAERAVVPLDNLSEAALVSGLDCVGVDHLSQAAAWLEGQEAGQRPVPMQVAPERDGPWDAVDLKTVRGQSEAKRALVVAAAGWHPMLISGPPGAGKTLLARCLPGLLPSLTADGALEVLSILSAAGLALPKAGFLPDAPPLRAPHHTCSVPALVGGGKPLRPGEVSLAHQGVLFLDEMPEFPRQALEALREPLEDGVVRIRRVHGSWELPARVLLIATTNPCPCGYLHSGECSCSSNQVRAYRSRISGPLRDRLDLVLRVEPVPYEVLAGRTPSNGDELDSATARARVLRARALQQERYTDRPAAERLNGRLLPRDLREHAWPDRAGQQLLSQAMRSGLLTARGHDRVLRVARTLADLEGAEGIHQEHVLDALALRQGARDLNQP
jgi:magnesium chelatase family protein